MYFWFFNIYIYICSDNFAALIRREIIIYDIYLYDFAIICSDNFAALIRREIIIYDIYLYDFSIFCLFRLSYFSNLHNAVTEYTD